MYINLPVLHIKSYLVSENIFHNSLKYIHAYLAFWYLNWNLTHSMLIIPNKETCFISPNVYPTSLWLHWYLSMPTFILPLQASMSIKASRFVLRTSECRQQWTLLHVLDIAHLVCVPNVLNPFVSFSHSIKLWNTSMTQK